MHKSELIHFHIPLVDACGRRIHDNEYSLMMGRSSQPPSTFVAELPPPPQTSELNLIPFLPYDESVPQRMGNLIVHLVRDSNDPNHPGLVQAAETHTVEDLCLLLDAIGIQPQPEENKAEFVKPFIPAVAKAKALAKAELEGGAPCLSAELRAALIEEPAPQAAFDKKIEKKGSSRKKKTKAATRSQKSRRMRRRRRSLARTLVAKDKGLNPPKLPEHEVARFARRLLEAYGDRARELVADLKRNAEAELNQYAARTCEQIIVEIDRISP
jgi:hypothetical protein